MTTTTPISIVSENMTDVRAEPVEAHSSFDRLRTNDGDLSDTKKSAIAGAQRRSLLLAAAILPLLLPACGVIQPLLAPAATRNHYALSDQIADAGTGVAVAAGTQAATLVVSPPRAAAGFDSPRMMYVRRAGQPEYFAYNVWIDTPARMLAPLIVSAVARSGAFRAVVPTPSPAGGELRLETEILRLQQDFLQTPGQLRFTLRAYLVETATRRVLATREFDSRVATASEDPQGGVTAANQAVAVVLAELAQFCAEAATRRSTAAGPTAAPSIP
jgi:cholesterol transport system auxiliary component